MSAVFAGAVACKGTDGDGRQLLHCRKRSGWNASSGYEGGPLQSYSRCQGRPCFCCVLQIWLWPWAPYLSLTLYSFFGLDRVLHLWPSPYVLSLALTLPSLFGHNRVPIFGLDFVLHPFSWLLAQFLTLTLWSVHLLSGTSVGLGGSVVRFGAFRPVGRRFESHSSRHVRTLGQSFTRSCL